MWNQTLTRGLQTLNLGSLPQWARLCHFWWPFGLLVELTMCYYLLWERYCFYSIKQWLIIEALQECSRTEETGGHSTLLEFLELSFCHTLCILQMFFLVSRPSSFRGYQTRLINQSFTHQNSCFAISILLPKYLGWHLKAHFERMLLWSSEIVFLANMDGIYILIQIYIDNSLIYVDCHLGYLIIPLGIWSLIVLTKI